MEDNNTLNRRFPTGGRAKGTPKNVSYPFWTNPVMKVPGASFTWVVKKPDTCTQNCR